MKLPVVMCLTTVMVAGVVCGGSKRVVAAESPGEKGSVSETEAGQKPALAETDPGAISLPPGVYFRPSETLKVEKAFRNSLDDGANAPASHHVVSENIYIVELKAPALASYKGSIQGLSATSPAVTGARHLDVNTQQSKAYSKVLLNEQNKVLQRCQESFGREVKTIQRYRNVFNGFAAKLSPEEVKWLSRLPEVKSVTKDRIREPLSDVGPQWVGAETFWLADETAWPPVKASKGEGTVIAIIDTGINNTHPSFADIGDDGYDHINPLGSGNYLPGSYCDTVDANFCNDKIIGAWSFVNNEELDPNSPFDNEGHGSHVASTAAGNEIASASVLAPTFQLERKISGVAPHANIIVYDACFFRNCTDASILAAIEQMVIDASVLPNGIQAANFSISVNDSPYSGPIAQAFLNATEAGIYIAAAAGNSGPSPSTVDNTAPWVATVAASTHTRTLSNQLINITSEEGSFGDIPGLSFTTGYGPAPIIYAGDYPTDNGSRNDNDSARCLDPFPEGHFNGEIVICDRGALPRDEKGANVLAGGAGGFVLVNPAIVGNILHDDPHVLPAIHIGADDGQALKDWLQTQTNPMATITGVVVNESEQSADIMGDFSSRGPELAFDVLKPDISAPGVSVYAAEPGSGSLDSPAYSFRSGTSMAAPHNAGAAALLAAIRPSWTPYEIKSALMLSANHKGLLKEDAFSLADPFDVGAGRLAMDHLQYVDIVLNEDPENFRASNPALGGNPAQLNLPSMQSSACVEKCRWTRKIKNAGEHYSIYELRPVAPEGINIEVSPPAGKITPWRRGGDRNCCRSSVCRK